MTATNWTDCLIIPTLVLPGPLSLQRLEKQKHRRSMCLDEFKKTDDNCAWCNTTKVISKRRKYCNSHCSDSANMWTYPQKNSAKGFLLYRQLWACAGCGESYEDHFKKRAEQCIKTAHQWKWPNPDKVPFYRLMDCTGHILHVDHIISIHHGGDGIGLNNVQVLCVKCHYAKSVYDRSEIKRPDNHQA